VKTILLIPVLGLALAATPAVADDCAELEAKVADLALRVANLEMKLAVAAKNAATEPTTAAAPKPATATGAAPAAAPAAAATQPAVAAAAPKPTAASQSAAREEALALYTRIDDLVAHGKVDEANRELASWNEKNAGSPAAAFTGSLTRELAVVGKAAPSDWSIAQWFQGQSEIALDGAKPTLVIFWEAWCPHCKAEVPKLEQVWEHHRQRGLQVLGVTRITQTATEESVRAFLAESGVRYPMAKETGALAEYFNVKGIPAAALVKDGTIVWRGHPTRLTEELLNAMF
jgi:thiol-disulfide isomerase/thioredoxin